MDDVFPPPYPLPAPIQATDFLGICPWQGWGQVGARAGLVVGTDYPPSTPLPPALFFSGSCRGKGGRRGPYDTLIFPAPPPPLHPRVQYAPGATGILGSRGGGGRYRDQRPPYHPSYASNPHNAPGPTRTTSGTLSQ